MAEPEAGLVDQLLTVFGALVAFVMATCVAFILGVHGHIKGRLRENPAFRKRVARELEEPKWSAPYLRGLDWALGRLDQIMGPINVRSGALQGFGFCATLALVYSSVFLIFGWGFFGASGQIGTVRALPDWDGRWRALFVLALVLYGVVVFYGIRWIRTRTRAVAGVGAGVGAGAGAVAVAGVGARAGAVPVAVAGAVARARARAVTVTGAGAGAGAGARAVARARAVTVTGAVAGARAVAGAVAGAVARAVAGVGAGAVALAGAGASAWLTNLENGQFVLILLWFVLPIVNAGADVISWWVSRWLGRHMQRTIGSATAYYRKLVSFIGHVLLDLGAACLFFALLAWLMPRYVASAESNLSLPLWEADGLVCQTAIDPWGEGAWPMMLLLSTLVPTAFHFGMALLGPWVALWLKWFRAPAVAAQLRAVPPDYCGEGQGGAVVSQAIDDAASKLTRAWFWAIITGAVIVAMLWVAWHQIEHALPALGYAIDAGLDVFKRWMLWVAYGFDWEPVTACLGA